jgi:hypothetical protein
MNWMSCSSTSASTSALDPPVEVVLSVVAIGLLPPWVGIGCLTAQGAR